MSDTELAVLEPATSTPAVQQPSTTPAVDLPPPAERFEFTGSGSEYFRIWIVNLLLTILTLGIYSAWAKVRRTRYFYNNTRVAGASFDYHGNPVSILKGRLIALAFIGAHQITLNAMPMLGLLIGLVLSLATPWLIWKSYQFKLYNSSYRGIRFGFRGTAGQVYKYYLLLPILSVFTAYLLWPFAHQRIRRFHHEGSRFGSSSFAFGASVGSFYKTYFFTALIGFGGLFVIVMTFGGAAAIGQMFSEDKQLNATQIVGLIGMVVVAYAWFFLMLPLFMTRLQNLVWNHTRLGPHRFRSEMKARRMMFIALTNLLGVVVTLGLFLPFAQVRAMKYRLESMSLLPAESLDEFVADAQQQASSMGEGAADLMDFDLSM